MKDPRDDALPDDELGGSSVESTSVETEAELHQPHDQLFRQALSIATMRQVLRLGLSPGDAEKAMTIEELVQKKYHQRGLQEGEAKLLERQLAKCFGELSDATRARLASASVEELELWAERVLSAWALEQVFDG